MKLLSKLTALVLFVLTLFSFSGECLAKVYYTYKLVKPVESFGLKFVDDKILASFFIDRHRPNSITVNIANISDAVITVEWSRGSMVVNGRAFNITLGTESLGASLSNVEAPPTSIPPGASARESVFIREYVKYDDIWNNWYIATFFSTSEKDVKNGLMKGSNVALFLPLLVDDQKVNYNFMFVIDTAEVDKKQGFIGVQAVDKKGLSILTLANAPIGTKAGEVFDRDGVKVTALTPKSSAEKAGIKTGDIIIKLNNHVIKDYDSFCEALNKYHSGDEVKVTYLRNSLEKTVTLKLR